MTGFCCWIRPRRTCCGEKRKALYAAAKRGFGNPEKWRRSAGLHAGGVAHDFNNLLTVITGYTQFLLNDLRELKIPGVNAAREILPSAAARCAKLSSQLLAFSRKQIVQPRVLDLNDLIRNMLQMLLRLISENIRLVTELDAALGPVKADSGQLKQVVVNLVVNSKDAMPGGGTLRIETRNIHEEAGDHIALTISDTGHGIDPDIQTQIFEPFFTTKN